MRPVAPTPLQLRPRSTAAVITTRSDGPLRDPATARPGPTRHPADAPRTQRRRWRRASALATWTVLGLLIVALWAILLLGDSLAPVAG